jgi:hypothetical protein
MKQDELSHEQTRHCVRRVNAGARMLTRYFAHRDCAVLNPLTF